MPLHRTGAAPSEYPDLRKRHHNMKYLTKGTRGNGPILDTEAQAREAVMQDQLLAMRHAAWRVWKRGPEPPTALGLFCFVEIERENNGDA